LSWLVFVAYFLPQAYFDGLRSRVVEAGQYGIYVSVMLFQGFSSQRKNMGGGNPWTGHPFTSATMSMELTVTRRAMTTAKRSTLW